MSFFGSNPGFGQTLDPFAGLERNKASEDEDDDGFAKLTSVILSLVDLTD